LGGLNERVDTSNTTHNEWMIHRELGDAIYLAHERGALPSLLAADEELLAVVGAGFRFADPGILGITDRRLIHLYFRRTLRRLRVIEIGYRRIETVGSMKSGSNGVLMLGLRQPRRTRSVPLRANAERAEELAACIRKAVARFDFHADQKARGYE
jgi:hypothetical protein